jgi:hypothetical protein
MRGKAFRRKLERFPPALDPGGERSVDISECLLGRGAGFGIARAPDAVETRRASACILVSLQRKAYSSAA